MSSEPSTSSRAASAEAFTKEHSVDEESLSSPLLDIAGRAEFALRAGSEAPDFQLLNTEGQSVSLSGLLKHGPLILLITHGPWCLSVLRQLEALATIHPQVIERSASLVAIAPRWSLLGDDDRSEVQMPLTFPFPLLVDFQAEVATRFGLSFRPSPDLQHGYRAMGYCDPLASADEALIIPATYLISRNGEIAFAFIDTDPTSFLEPKALLSMLDSLSLRSDSDRSIY